MARKCVDTREICEECEQTCFNGENPLNESNEEQVCWSSAGGINMLHNNSEASRLRDSNTMETVPKTVGSLRFQKDVFHKH